MKKRQEKLESSSNVTDGEPGTRLGPLEYDCDFEEKRIIKVFFHVKVLFRILCCCCFSLI